MSSSNNINGGFKKTSRFWPCLPHIITCVSVAFYYCIIQKSAFRGILWKSCSENFDNSVLGFNWKGQLNGYFDDFTCQIKKFSYKDKTNEIKKILLGTSSDKFYHYLILS